MGYQKKLFYGMDFIYPQGSPTLDSKVVYSKSEILLLKNFLIIDGLEKKTFSSHTDFKTKSSEISESFSFWFQSPQKGVKPLSIQREYVCSAVWSHF